MLQTQIYNLQERTRKNAILGYKHYKNAITNAVQLRLFLSEFLTGVFILFMPVSKDMHCPTETGKEPE